MDRAEGSVPVLVLMPELVLVPGTQEGGPRHSPFLSRSLIADDYWGPGCTWWVGRQAISSVVSVGSKRSTALGPCSSVVSCGCFGVDSPSRRRVWCTGASARGKNARASLDGTDREDQETLDLGASQINECFDKGHTTRCWKCGPSNIRRRCCVHGLAA